MQTLDDAGPPEKWSRRKLVDRVIQWRKAFKTMEEGRLRMTQELEAERQRAEMADRQVRDLRRELERERKRAEAAEARLKSMGCD